MENVQEQLPQEITLLTKNEKLIVLFNDFNSLRQVYSAGIKEIRTKLEILDDEFHVKYDHNPIHNMEYRLKSPKSLFEKANKKNIPLNMDSIAKHITDIAGVRVICNYIEDIYKIAELLTNQDDVTLLKVKDYIKKPKANGYRSLHLVVEIPIFLSDRKQPIPVEIQIRTIAMDFWASLEHSLKYKSSIVASQDIQDELLDCAETISKLDIKMQSIYSRLQK